MLQTYMKDHPDEVDDKTMLRVFVLTDGLDNASKQAAWQVAQYLQKYSIILDAFHLLVKIQFYNLWQQQQVDYV